MTQRDNPVKLHLKIKKLLAEIERLKQPCKDAKYVPMLVEALKSSLIAYETLLDMQGGVKHPQQAEVVLSIEETLAQLPEEVRR